MPAIRSVERAGGAGLRAAIGTLLAAAALLANASARAVAPADGRDVFDRVVIDAGHGGDDHGAEGPTGLREKDLVLDVARRVRDRLERRGLSVVLTRDSDVYVPLDERTAIANRSQADLFLSIHANAASVRAARGVETFFLALEASDESAQRLAERENAAFHEQAAATSNDPLASILGDLAATDQMRDSDEFARFAHAELSALDTSIPSRGVKQAPFVVLMGVEMPAALVEIGFITNPAEEREMRSDAWRDRVADALVRAVVRFGDRYDARRGVARPSRRPDAAPPALRGGG